MIEFGGGEKGVTSRQARYLCHSPTQSSLCHCPLANFSAYQRLKHSWYAARSSEHAAAAAEEAAAAGGGDAVDEDDLLRPNTILSGFGSLAAAAAVCLSLVQKPLKAEIKLYVIVLSLSRRSLVQIATTTSRPKISASIDIRVQCFVRPSYLKNL